MTRTSRWAGVPGSKSTTYRSKLDGSIFSSASRSSCATRSFREHESCSKPGTEESQPPLDARLIVRRVSGVPLGSVSSRG